MRTKTLFLSWAILLIYISGAAKSMTKTMDDVLRSVAILQRE